MAGQAGDSAQRVGSQVWDGEGNTTYMHQYNPYNIQCLLRTAKPGSHSLRCMYSTCRYSLVAICRTASCVGKWRQKV